MSSTSLEWEYESSLLCVGRKLFKLPVVGRQFKTSVIVHSSSPLTNFLSYVFTAHCSRAPSLSLLSHTHTNICCSHTLTQLLWSEISICISFHSAASSMHINTAIPYHSFSVKPCPCSLQFHFLQLCLRSDYILGLHRAESELKAPCFSLRYPLYPLLRWIHPLLLSKDRKAVGALQENESEINRDGVQSLHSQLDLKRTKFSVYRLPPLLCKCFITPQCLDCGTEGDRKEGREEDRGCLHIEENAHRPTVPPAPSFSSISPFCWRWIPSTNPSSQSHSSNKHSPNETATSSQMLTKKTKAALFLCTSTSLICRQMKTMWTIGTVWFIYITAQSHCRVHRQTQHVKYYSDNIKTNSPQLKTDLFTAATRGKLYPNFRSSSNDRRSRRNSAPFYN